MKGYPKYIATVQDFRNLLEMEENKEQAIADLKDIYNTDDDKATIATTQINPKDPESEWNTELINNPMPLWKQKGFKYRNSVGVMIVEFGGKI